MEAARIDGSSEYSIFFRIMVALLKPQDKVVEIANKGQKAV